MSDHPKSTFSRRVRAARPRAKRYDIRDDVIPGLLLRRPHRAASGAVIHTGRRYRRPSESATTTIGSPRWDRSSSVFACVPASG